MPPANTSDITLTQVFDLLNVLADSNAGVISFNLNVQNPRDKKLIYDLIVVIRRNPILIAQANELDDDDATELLQKPYDATVEICDAWKNLAADIWEGRTEIGDWANDLKWDFGLPEHPNSNITIFGTVFKPTGESITLTMTENSDPRDMMFEMQMGYWAIESCLALFDNSTNLNLFGARPYRQTTYLDKSANSSNGSSETKPEKPQKSVTPASDTPKAQNAQFCETIAEIDNVAYGDVFSLEIGKIAFGQLGESGIYNFYGFTKGKDGKKKLDTHKNIFVFEDSKEMPAFKAQMEGLAIVLAKGTELKFTGATKIGVFKKLESKSGKPYYIPMTFFEQQ